MWLLFSGLSVLINSEWDGKNKDKVYCQQKINELYK